MSKGEERKLRIGIASDHGGYNLKKVIFQHLKEKGYEVVDYGTHSEDRTDYPLYAAKAIKEMLSGNLDRCILICGTGQGMVMVANKFKGVRAALCWDVTTARLSRAHNNANVLALGGRLIGPELAKEIVDVWLSTEFDGGRHSRRINSFSSIGAGIEEATEIIRTLERKGTTDD